jgi:hypothetical protein
MKEARNCIIGVEIMWLEIVEGATQRTIEVYKPNINVPPEEA